MQVVEQSRQVLGRVPVREGPGTRNGSAVAALVPRDDAMAVAQHTNLRVEHVGVHEKAVTQDQGERAASGVLVEEPLAAHLGEGHWGAAYIQPFY